MIGYMSQEELMLKRQIHQNNALFVITGIFEIKDLSSKGFKDLSLCLQ